MGRSGRRPSCVAGQRTTRWARPGRDMATHRVRFGPAAAAEVLPWPSFAAAVLLPPAPVAATPRLPRVQRQAAAGSPLRRPGRRPRPSPAPSPPLPCAASSQRPSCRWAPRPASRQQPGLRRPPAVPQVSYVWAGSWSGRPGSSASRRQPGTPQPRSLPRPRPTARFVFSSSPRLQGEAGSRLDPGPVKRRSVAGRRRAAKLHFHPRRGPA